MRVEASPRLTDAEGNLVGYVLPIEDWRSIRSAIRAGFDDAMGGPTCGRCGKPATGFATIGDQRFCHGDHDETPTCYERATWAAPHGAFVQWEGRVPVASPASGDAR